MSVSPGQLYYTKKHVASNYQREKPVVPRCKTCGLRIRGENHDDGREHQERIKK